MPLSQWLGIQYMWIDSLCIIQDDKTGWEEQAAEMGRIYENSYLTVSAARAATGADGLFADRRTYTSKETSSGILVRKKLRHSHEVDALGDPEANHPLLCRGWCLQEGLLAPRVLHHGQDEML